jgi:hypothetical protein
LKVDKASARLVHHMAQKGIGRDIALDFASVLLGLGGTMLCLIYLHGTGTPPLVLLARAA